MIYVTGDMHGSFSRLKRKSFAEQIHMTKSDYVIICGDFGIWDNSPQEREWMKWLDAKPFTTLFVDGNHENFDRLSKYPVSDWNGGKVQYINDSVIHLMRGQVYELCGKLLFTMGGASSHDISAGILDPDAPDFKTKKKQLDAHFAMYRINHLSWWKEELPSQEEYEISRNNLSRYGWKVDYIITHCCPSSILNTFSNGIYQPDHLTEFLDEVKDRCSFDHWFFGHYHDNRIVQEKYVMLYKKILQIV